MSLKTQMADDFAKVVLNADEFAEDISYIQDGDTKAIKAIIVRSRLEGGVEDGGRISRNQCEAYIANGTEYGMAAVNKGKDTVQFPERVGESNATWAVIDVISKDSAMWHLLVEK